MVEPVFFCGSSLYLSDCYAYQFPMKQRIFAASLAACVLAMACESASADVPVSTFTFRLYSHGISVTTPSAGNNAPNAGACSSGAASSCATLGGQLSVNVGASSQGILSSTCKSSGKWYYEVTPTALSGSPLIRAAIVGWASAVPTSTGNGTTDANTFGFSEYAGYGNYASRSTETTVGGTPYSTSDVVGVAIDLDAHTMSVYRQGVLNVVVYSGIPAGTYCPMVVRTGSLYNDSATSTFNFGQSNFSYPVPAGYNAGVF